MDTLLAWFAALLISVTSADSIPARYTDSGMVRGDECGEWTNTCWHELKRVGIGPLTQHPESGMSWLHTLGQTLWCESRFGATLRNQNRDGSWDRGIAQWNNRYHPWITDALAFNPVMSIRLMVDHWVRGLAQWWVCYVKLFK